MKTKSILSISLMIFASPLARAQAIVQDPIAHAIAQSDHIVDLLKYIEMINNQIEQIQTLTAQLEQVETYVERFGDAGSLLEIESANSLVGSLEEEGAGETIAVLRNAADGASALQYTGNGLYRAISKNSPGGIEVVRDSEGYKKFATVTKTTQNFEQVYDDVSLRRSALKSDIASTTKALQAATTDQETQKLTALLVAQSATLDDIDNEVSFAAFQALVQDAENRNDTARQELARQEEIAAERDDALSKLGEILVPDTTKKLRFGRK